MSSFENMSPDSRLWIYQANRKFDANEIVWLNEQLISFAKDWSSHGAELTAHAEVLGECFLVFAVDNEQTNASGCSIDKSVRLVKEIGTELKIDFFNRLKVLKEDIAGNQDFVSFSKISDFENDFVFNILIDKLGDLNSKFKIKVSNYIIENQLI